MWSWGSKVKLTSSSDKLKELKSKPLKERQDITNEIKTKFPDSLPVIIYRSSNQKNLPDIPKIRFIIPRDYQYSHIIGIVRKRVTLDSATAIFLFVGDGHIPSATSSIANVYEEHKSDDGFLYITYNGENTFG